MQWGPTFLLNPAFAPTDEFLLGREDFFQAFTVTFENEASGPVFYLEY